ncbi:phasin family protein [Pararhodobacter zhoushanensis]|uniref:Phasin family protein n=1 Tax=Pararhodobacter zhoushanensis TaxID=2479545 RepID=A0ABT3GY58_9RHOB|nr:phasin family protein [Pararhodobacter zhoushanensis]MCW1932463.1 phasin family protein [Pararhodobacter zhoushanensis]
MTKNDFTKSMQDMMGAFPVDTKAMQDAFKTQAALGEKMSKVVLEAAEKSAEVSTKWTKSTLAKIGEVSTVKAEPADYAKAYTDFASASAEMASEHMSAFAEIAKRVQMDTVELMLAAGKDMSAEATAAVQKATTDMTAAAKKATDEVTAAAKKAGAAAK